MGNTNTNSNTNTKKAVRLKCVVVGDPFVGKTSLLVTMKEKKFPDCYCPALCDNYFGTTTVNGQQIEYTLWDSFGSEDYKRFRVPSYPNTYLFIIAYSVVDYTSYLAVSKWYDELKEHQPRAKILLLGTKIDLRYDDATLQKLELEGQEVLTVVDGTTKAEEIGAIGYFECSSAAEEGVQELHDTILQFFYVVITGHNLEAIENYRTKLPQFSTAKSARK